MREFTQLIVEDMKPALGVTEPGAIAFAVATAKSYTKGKLGKIRVNMNSGMFKNAFTCGIPNTREVGNVFAAALGYVAGDAERGLECLDHVTEKDNAAAKKLIKSEKVEVELSSISSKILIHAIITTDRDECEVTIKDSHTNICEVKLNDNIILKKRSRRTAGDNGSVAAIHRYTLEDICHYAETVSLSELEFIEEAYHMNLELFEFGLESERTVFSKKLKEANNNLIYSDDVRKTAQLLCNGAIEARVLGLERPAMSITGSGAHGIICTLPLYAAYKVGNLKKEQLLRATAVSYLITMYIKEYSGKLSAFCGCAIAAGTGMACGLAYINGGHQQEITHVIQNMASGITGMICDGGNQGCIMKGIVAVDAAFQALYYAINGISIDAVHGINGKTPEDTMRNMGLIASPGMVKTEKAIIEIMQNKKA